MKVFVLDPDYKDEPKNYSDFCDLAVSKFGWEISHSAAWPEAMQDGTKGDEWIDDLIAGVSESEVILCFSDYSHFRMFGDKDTRLVDLVCDKFRSGCAVLLQTDNIAGSIAHQNLPISLRQIFKCIGAEPLPYRIWSKSCIEEGQQHQYVCWFDQNSFRDRALFRNVDRINAYVPSLVAYDLMGHPIIDVEPPDYFVTDSGDLPWRGRLGIRHSNAVVCDSYDSIQIVIGGRIFDNSSRWGFGESDPLFEKNYQFALNVLGEINRSAPTTERYRTETWASWYKLEMAMGELLENAIGLERLMRELPPKIRDRKLQEFDEVDYSQFYFSDLDFLIRSHWQELGPLFDGTSRKQLKELLYKINSGPRRYVTHAIKSKAKNFQFDAETLSLVESTLEILRDANKRLHSQDNEF